MLLVQSPLRISFFGGGSDIPQFYQKHAGRVLSTTIDKGLWLAVNRMQSDDIKVVYSKIEQEESIWKIKHDLVRETLKSFGLINGIEISSFANIPINGTGLGSSSAFTVALIHACLHLQRRTLTPHEIAELASRIEIEYCNQPIGKQDQYAAAFGGFNQYDYNQDGSVDVKKVAIPTHTLVALERSIMMFHTGILREAKNVMTEQVGNLSNTENTATHTTWNMTCLVSSAICALLANNIAEFGRIMDIAWNHKKKLSSTISTAYIDEVYATARAAGAWGGKLLGAGGGGFMMLIVPPGKQKRVWAAMPKSWQYHPMKFVDYGARIVYTG